MNRAVFILIAFFLLISVPGLSQTYEIKKENSLIRFFEPEIRALINEPADLYLKSDKPLDLIIYALPNGNTIEQTFGKRTSDSFEWRYEIQHIGAQTRMLRNICPEKNIVVVYLEAKEKSFPSWRKKFPGAGEIINSIIDSLRLRYAEFHTSVILTGHSGGGSFIFGFLNYHKTIPDYVKRISFLDSNYGYSREEGHFEKLLHWLKKDTANFLSVIAYDDRNIELDGKKVVSRTGGTFRRTMEMKEDFNKEFGLVTFTDSVIEKSVSLKPGVELIIHLNPENKILHTVLVELNGFMQAMLAGRGRTLPFEFFGKRGYEEYIRN